MTQGDGREGGRPRASRPRTPSLTIEFQGGEPLVNFDGREAHHRRTRAAEEQGLRQAARVHDGDATSRSWTRRSSPTSSTTRCRSAPASTAPSTCTTSSASSPGGNSHTGRDPLDRAHQRGLRGDGPRPDALPRRGAAHDDARGAQLRRKEIVDTYVVLGCRALFLRPVDPFGFADKTAPRVEYAAREYRDFYRTAVDYIIELNKQRRADPRALRRHLPHQDPRRRRPELPRHPLARRRRHRPDCLQLRRQDLHVRRGADAGRDSRRRHVPPSATCTRSNYRDLMTHETVRALAIASILDAQPDCVNCTYAPYCGVRPVHNHKTQGSIFGRMRESTLCACTRASRTTCSRSSARTTRPRWRSSGGGRPSASARTSFKLRRRRDGRSPTSWGPPESGTRPFRGARG